MNSSDTSAKYSCPSKEQKDEIQDSGEPEELDILAARAAVQRLTGTAAAGL
jgi:hypothetical protein